LNGFNEDEAEAVSEPSFLSDAENHALVESIRSVCMRFEAPDFRLFLSGSPVVIDSIRRSLISDANRFVKIALLMIGACLFLMFRRLSGVLLPLVIVACALVSTLSLMPIFNVAFTVPSNILPSFILVVGLADSIHILSMFYRFHGQTGDRKLAICKALGHSGLAVVLTSLTTAAGLASFATAEVAPIAHLGMFSSIGVMLALFYSIFLLPALLSIVPIAKKHAAKSGTRDFVDRLLVNLSDFAVQHYKGLIVMTVIITAVSVPGLFRLSFSHNPIIWLPETTPIRTDTDKVDQELKGTAVLEVIIDTGRENGLHDPDILNTMDALAHELKTFQRGKIFVGKVSSIADILKEIHQSLNENRLEYNAIPQDHEVISQEFLLFENSGSDDLSTFMDSQFSRTRLTIKVPWGDAIEYMPILRSIEERFKEAFAGSAQITATGMMSLLVRVFYAAMHSAARSYMIAFGVIGLMMILLMGNLRLGLLSMVPNLLPIVLSLGFIGWLDFPLDMFTMLIGSIAIGLAVDDTVHFMHNYRRYFARTKDVREATRQTLLTAGRAMVVTSIVLAAGFFIYMFATMKNLYYFGMITGITVITALLADLVVAPALMALVSRRSGAVR
jgi:predicted RND superfamily exporter protein